MAWSIRNFCVSKRAHRVKWCGMTRACHLSDGKEGPWAHWSASLAEWYKPQKGRGPASKQTDKKMQQPTQQIRWVAPEESGT